MSILIGGPGSSGSSLVRTILNRHPELFSGAELSLFNKEPVFTNWGGIKQCILTRRGSRLTTCGWFPYPAHNLLHSDYSWSAGELGEVLEQSKSISDFATLFFEKSLKNNGSSIWVEKTPSNAYCFQLFLAQFSQGKVIHITRNPLDCVASLVNRGMTPYFAAGIWIYNNAAALRSENKMRYHRITYENMVQNPVREVKLLTNFIGVSDTPNIVDPAVNEREDPAKISSWRYARNDPVKSNKSGTFQLCKKKVRDEIVTALSAIRIHPNHVKKYSLQQSNCMDVCEALKYPFEPKILLTGEIRKQQFLDITKRTINRYATHWPHQPGSLRFE